MNRPGTSNFSNVISQILLCKTITPDFNAEEICSIAKDSEEIGKILQEMQEYMPQQENQAGKLHFHLNGLDSKKNLKRKTWPCWVMRSAHSGRKNDAAHSTKTWAHFAASAGRIIYDVYQKDGSLEELRPILISIISIKENTTNMNCFALYNAKHFRAIIRI